MRAATTQSAISRIERDRLSPSVATLEELLFLLGEDLVLDSTPRQVDIDMKAMKERLALSPHERLQRGIENANRVLHERRRKAAESADR
jgi:transcriptional regulator with XRE-family HTH domain